MRVCTIFNPHMLSSSVALIRRALRPILLTSLLVGAAAPVYVRQGATYDNGLDIGARSADPDGTIRVTLTGLPDGQTSYLAISTYAGGVESTLSNEQSVLTNSANPTETPTSADSPSPTPT